MNIRAILWCNGKIQHSSALRNTKYNCVVLFLSQLHWLFIYASKCIFPLYDLFDKAEFLALHTLWYEMAKV